VIIMSDDARKVRRKLSALTKSLDDLETILASLLSQSLPDLIIDLDTIQQAKLQVVIPYLVYDLVFGPSRNSHSLSTRGSTHRHSL
jgi:exosome complex protein LRP1